MSKENPGVIFDASNSWNGYNHQGKLSILFAIKQILEIYDNTLSVDGNRRVLDEYFIEIEYLEDFSIGRHTNGKGDMKTLATSLICQDLIEHLEVVYPEVFWKEHYPILFQFIKIGRYSILEEDEIFSSEDVLEIVKDYRKRYRDKEYFTKPRFDKVGITTLFTFYWDITIKTINFAKQLCKILWMPETFIIYRRQYDANLREKLASY